MGRRVCDSIAVWRRQNLTASPTQWIREFRITPVFLVMGIICSCAEKPRSVQQQLSDLCPAVAVSWLDEINDAETRYWLGNKKYAVLADLKVDPPDFASVDFHLADSDHYDLRLRCPTGLDIFRTDQTGGVRRCRKSEDPTDTCPPVDRLTLIATDPASLNSKR
jgi:hypothetical protein